MIKKETPSFCPANRQQWRQWLSDNHSSQQAVWLVYYRKHSALASIGYSEAVDEALCFGWIDSTRKSLDENTFTQFFCRRKPNSVWSKVNKAKVQRLAAEGLMAPAGLASIEAAKENGSWYILDEVEELIVPADLEAALQQHKGAEAFFLSLSRSVRKSILQWLVLAKKQETRAKRITEIATLAAQKLKPKHLS